MYVIGKSVNSEIVEGRKDLRECTLLNSGHEIKVLLHFFNHDDQVALYSINLMSYTNVYLLRVYGRDERRYEKEDSKRHHP